MTLEDIEKDHPALLLDCFDLAPPPGWVGTVAASLGRLDALREAMPGLRVLQVKSKFGGLRIYTNHDGDSRVDAIVRAAEETCAATCEICAAPDAAPRTIRGWCWTTCEQCANERDRNSL